MSWQLPDSAFRFLSRLSAGATVVELGSGEGTQRLLNLGLKVHSVEHDPAWIGRVPGARYIHAPIVDGWYDPMVLAREVPLRYDALIIDGPPGTVGRLGLLANLGLFRKGPTLVDDVHRPDEQRLLMGLVEIWRVPAFSIHHLQDRRAFATFGWGDL